MTPEEQNKLKEVLLVLLTENPAYPELYNRGHEDGVRAALQIIRNAHIILTNEN